ncbi:MAG: replication initiation protein [Acidithiobacillus sp.]
MFADLTKKDWISILKRNNALTRENVRRALKNCDDEHQRLALQTEMGRLNANAKYSTSTKGNKTQKGFGTRNQRVEEIPPEYRFFVDHLPYKPYCTDDLTTGLQVRPTQQALTHAYLQFNSPAMVWTLAQDIDRDVDRDYFSRHKAPQPNCIVRNRVNNHAHALYFLSAGVCRTSAAKLKPLRYLAVIEGALCRQLEADPGFSGLITKNPLHDIWETWNLHDRLYSLGDLAEYLDLSAANAKDYRATLKEAHGLGRNVTMFDEGRIWAYQAIREHWAPNGLDRWAKLILERLEGINGQFQAPLPFSEVKATAKSISKWTWVNMTPGGLQELIQRTHTSGLQAERGRKATNQAEAGIASGEARRRSREQERATARIMVAQGKSTRQIGAEIGVDQSTVVRWLADQVMHERPISDNSRLRAAQRSAGCPE